MIEINNYLLNCIGGFTVEIMNGKSDYGYCHIPIPSNYICPFDSWLDNLHFNILTFFY